MYQDYVEMWSRRRLHNMSAKRAVSGICCENQHWWMQAVGCMQAKMNSYLVGTTVRDDIYTLCSYVGNLFSFYSILTLLYSLTRESQYYGGWKGTTLQAVTPLPSDYSARLSLYSLTPLPSELSLDSPYFHSTRPRLLVCDWLCGQTFSCMCNYRTCWMFAGNFWLASVMLIFRINTG
jgi:hypothetical protein